MPKNEIAVKSYRLLISLIRGNLQDLKDQHICANDPKMETVESKYLMEVDDLLQQCEDTSMKYYGEYN